MRRQVVSRVATFFFTGNLSSRFSSISLEVNCKASRFLKVSRGFKVGNLSMTKGQLDSSTKEPEVGLLVPTGREPIGFKRGSEGNDFKVNEI